jgi:hypothetical protein
MSSKIEIERTLLSHAVTLLSSIHSDVSHQLTALLAAPVVERQPVAITKQKYLAIGTGCIKKDGVTVELLTDLPARTKLYTAPPELAELQATIARLETQVNNAINLDFERRETIAQLTAEIERLKGGQGEPVDLSELREYHAKAISNLKSYADDEGLRDSDVKHYTKRAAFHEEMVALIDKVKELNQ